MNEDHSLNPDQAAANIILSGSFENENYRMIYDNPYQSPMKPKAVLTPLYNTCFLGFIQSCESKPIGPFILNITQDDSDKSLQIVDLDLDLFDEDKYNDHNQTQIRIIRSTQKKMEQVFNDRNPKTFTDANLTSKPLMEHLTNKQLCLKITPLPFDHFFINSANNRRIPGVEIGSQTISNPNTEHYKDDDLISVLREQIQVLKDQNQLLRLQHDVNIRRSGSRPTKEYVIRKQSASTTKSTRNPSAASTDIVIESESIKSQTQNKTVIADENSSLQEMLQEYMLENEALRQHNNSLEEFRASHHSELDNMSRRNKELSMKLEDLIKKIKTDNSSNQLPIDLNQSTKSHHETNREKDIRNYPITYDRSEEELSLKNSYLRQYDSMRNKHHFEATRRALAPAKVNHSTESNPITSADHFTTSQQGRHITNDSLLEELSRIDVTIKEHIRKNQFNETLRNMGKRQSPRKY